MLSDGKIVRVKVSLPSNTLSSNNGTVNETFVSPGINMISYGPESKSASTVICVPVNISINLFVYLHYQDHLTVCYKDHSQNQNQNPRIL